VTYEKHDGAAFKGSYEWRRGHIWEGHGCGVPESWEGVSSIAAGHMAFGRTMGIDRLTSIVDMT
jgi:hypothetical protein